MTTQVEIHTSSPFPRATSLTENPAQASGVRHFRPDIQGLRAVAILLVVLYHADVPGITGGYVGVDVFFVISGFLITGQLMREVQKNGHISFVSFYVGRIRRLLPPAALVLLVTLVVARLWGSVFQLKSTAWDAILTAVYALNYRLAAEGVNYQQVSGPESPLQHFWSLAVEEQFYLAWPLIIALCILISRRHHATLVTGVLLVICASSLYFSVTVTSSNAPLAYFSIHTRAWELGLGALLALVAGRLLALPQSVAVMLSWAGIGAILWSGFTYTDETAFPGAAALVPVLGALAIITAGCRPSSGSAEMLLNRRPMQGIGKISYAWYLWHWPVVILVPLMFGREFVWWENVELIILGLWLAVLTYWIVESPTRHSRLRKPAWIAAGLALSGAVAAAAAIVIITLPSLVGSGVAVAAVELTKADVSAVKNAVEAATSAVAVPSNLQPALATAIDDQPVTTASGCHIDFLIVDQRDCTYGDPAGQQTMVLLGDSHAQQWFPALDAAAKQNHWQLVSWTKAACPIAHYDIYSTELHRPYTECIEWRERAIKKIIALKPDLVLIGQSDSVPGTAIGNVDWAENTVITIRRLQAESIPVGYILDTPYPGINVPECVANNLDDVGACTVKREYVWPYDGRHETMTQTLAAANVATVEPIEWLCTINDCPAIVGNMLVYRDASHISTAYSAWLAPMMAPLFNSRPSAQGR
jgi:peptidoglycan/LPS O-acetylase OafA/YrhL